MAKRKKALCAASALAALLCLGVWAFDARLKTVRYTLPAPFPQPVTLAVVSDLHSCFYGENQQELVAAIFAAQPDLLLFTGDICDDVLPHENTWKLLAAVAGKILCYYVTGNHEHWSGEVDAIKAAFERYGVTVLSGQCVSVVVRGAQLNLCGLDDPAPDVYVTKPYSSVLAELAEAANNGGYTVLLTHRPERVAEYLEHPFRLILAGHAHGGQWRVPGLINGLFAPNQGFFPKYAGGRYSFGSATMLVSRGLARESTRLPRLFNRPELVVATLTDAAH